MLFVAKRTNVDSVVWPGLRPGSLQHRQGEGRDFPLRKKRTSVCRRARSRLVALAQLGPAGLKHSLPSSTNRYAPRPHKVAKPHPEVDPGSWGAWPGIHDRIGS